MAGCNDCIHSRWMTAIHNTSKLVCHLSNDTVTTIMNSYPEMCPIEFPKCYVCGDPEPIMYLGMLICEKCM